MYVLRVLARSAAALMIVSSGGAYAATMNCASLKPAMERSHIPDLAIAVFKRGKAKSIFCSSSAHLVSSDAVFEAASLSKPVFAIGVLKLAEEGKLDLDRPLVEYLDHPYEHQQNPFGLGATDMVSDPSFAKITARMVLSHSSGLPNWSHHAPLLTLSTPGEKWSYSSEAYVYLQHVVEAITKKPAGAFLQEEILVPLGMTHSSFEWRPSFAASILHGHSTSGATQPIVQYGQPVVSSTLYTTLGDYSNFVSQMLNPASGFPFASERRRQIGVRPDLHLAWGLGVAIEETARPSYFHWGANPGLRSFFLCQPMTGNGVLFFADSDNGLDLLNMLVHASVPGPHPILRFPMLHPRD